MISFLNPNRHKLKVVFLPCLSHCQSDRVKCDVRKTDLGEQTLQILNLMISINLNKNKDLTLPVRG